MMISPEVYYEEQLKGKTKEQIMRFIRGLKQEIGHLKNMMESPDYAQESVIHPSEDVRLDCTREYLEKAKQAYAEVGGTYSMSKSEEKAANFELNMDFIFKITFGIGNGKNKKYRRNQKLLFGDQGRIENHCGTRNPFSKQS